MHVSQVMQERSEMTYVNGITPTSVSHKPSISSGAARGVWAQLAWQVGHSKLSAPHCPLPLERHISHVKCFLLSPASCTCDFILRVTSPPCFSGSRLQCLLIMQPNINKECPACSSFWVFSSRTQPHAEPQDESHNWDSKLGGTCNSGKKDSYTSLKNNPILTGDF